VIIFRQKFGIKINIATYKDIMGCKKMYKDNNRFIMYAIKGSLAEWIESNIPLCFDYTLHSRESRGKITHIEFHIEKIAPDSTPAQEKATEIGRAVKTFKALDSAQKNQMIICLFHGKYHFKLTQHDAILADEYLLGRFYEVHSKIEKNIITPANRTAYMAKCLGFTDASKWKK
jgi:hypothetical protein